MGGDAEPGKPGSPGPRCRWPGAGLRRARALFVSRSCFSGEGKRGGGGKWGEKKGEGRTSEERGRELKILGNQVSPQRAAGAAAFLLCIPPQQEHALGY